MLDLAKGYFLKWVGPDPPPEKPLSLRDIIIDDNINKYYMYNPDIRNSARPLNLDFTSEFRYLPQYEPIMRDSDFLESEITTLQKTLKNSKNKGAKHVTENETKATDKEWKKFAFTPEDKEFFESIEDKTDHESKSAGKSYLITVFFNFLCRPTA